MGRILIAVLVSFCVQIALAGEAEESVIAEIEVRGNSHLLKETVLSFINSRVGKPYIAKMWEEDWRRLDRTGLLQEVRTTEPIAAGANKVKLAIDLIEQPSFSDLIVKGVDAENAANIRVACAGFLGGLNTPAVRESIAATIKAKQGQNTDIEFTTVATRLQNRQIAGRNREVTEAVKLLINVKDRH